mmetsp:Transcript_7310/g.18025  ORF Transcript_7310/g.18025 Transcript_7310/m.18025 type:complete len:279 (-) Transcript_7310:101-937(-)
MDKDVAAVAAEVEEGHPERGLGGTQEVDGRAQHEHLHQPDEKGRPDEVAELLRAKSAPVGAAEADDGGRDAVGVEGHGRDVQVRRVEVVPRGLELEPAGHLLGHARPGALVDEGAQQELHLLQHVVGVHVEVVLEVLRERAGEEVHPVLHELLRLLAVGRHGGLSQRGEGPAEQVARLLGQVGPARGAPRSARVERVRVPAVGRARAPLRMPVHTVLPVAPAETEPAPLMLLRVGIHTARPSLLPSFFLSCSLLSGHPRSPRSTSSERVGCVRACVSV